MSNLDDNYSDEAFILSKIRDCLYELAEPKDERREFIKESSMRNMAARIAAGAGFFPEELARESLKCATALADEVLKND